MMVAWWGATMKVFSWAVGEKDLYTVRLPSVGRGTMVKFSPYIHVSFVLVVLAHEMLP
jgi:hypothetical protein